MTTFSIIEAHVRRYINSCIRLFVLKVKYDGDLNTILCFSEQEINKDAKQKCQGLGINQDKLCKLMNKEVITKKTSQIGDELGVFLTQKQISAFVEGIPSQFTSP